MIVKIKEILETSNRKSKTGNPYVLTTFKGEDDKLYKDIYGKFEVGQTIEGEWKDSEWGPKFEVSKSEKSSWKKGPGGDPDTMLIAYGKDIVVAMIQAGIIKDPKDIAKQINAFSLLHFKIYDTRKGTQKPAENASTVTTEATEEVLDDDFNDIKLED